MRFRSKLTGYVILTLLFISLSLWSKSQTCSSTTGVPGWTTVGSIANAASTSFDWQNTTTAGQFQAGNYLSPNITSVSTPILQYQDVAPHNSINIAYDLAASGASATINGYEITVIWGSAGSNQVTCGGGLLTITSTPTRYNFQISGITLPGNHTLFQVRLKFFIWNSKNVNASNFKTDAALANSGATLSVQVSSFTAVRNNNNVNINWTTNYEINSSGFEVQRRYSNQANFETIAFINSKGTNGTSTGANYYSYTDINTSTSVTYYRLRQVNMDGTAKFTEIREVDGSRMKAKTLVYPNPASTGVVNVIFTNPNSKQVSVFDMNGRVVRSWGDQIGQELKIGGLQPGVYSISIINTASTEKETVRLVVTR